MIREAISHLKKDKNLHAKFVNSLSVLEFAGARKIIKSQKAHSLDSELLSHISEEIRHARVLKNIALKLSDGRLETYEPQHLLAGDAAWKYIQTVDHAVDKDFQEPNPWLNYLYTTLLIEERAMNVYPFYSEILAEFGFKNAIEGMILEEASHLEYTRKHIKDDDLHWKTRLQKFREIEEKAFGEFMKSVSTEAAVLNNKDAHENNSHP